MNWPFGVVLPILGLFVAGYEIYPEILDKYRIFLFSNEVEAFAETLADARQKSLAVAFDRRTWRVLDGAEVLRSGVFSESVRVGTNIPGGRIWWDSSGACHTRLGGCLGREISLASDAPTLCQVVFERDGRPVSYCDPFNASGDSEDFDG